MKHIDPYLTAEALGIHEDQRTALITVMQDLLHGRYPEDEWSMRSWQHCICGHMREHGVFIDEGNTKLLPLFLSNLGTGLVAQNASQKQAGQACLNMLTIGKPDWPSAMEKS